MEGTRAGGAGDRGPSGAGKDAVLWLHKDSALPAGKINQHTLRPAPGRSQTPEPESRCRSTQTGKPEGRQEWTDGPMAVPNGGDIGSLRPAKSAALTARGYAPNVPVG